MKPAWVAVRQLWWCRGLAPAEQVRLARARFRLWAAPLAQARLAPRVVERVVFVELAVEFAPEPEPAGTLVDLVELARAALQHQFL